MITWIVFSGEKTPPVVSERKLNLSYIVVYKFITLFTLTVLVCEVHLSYSNLNIVHALQSDALCKALS